MELVLKHASKPAVHLQWDKEPGTLQGDQNLIDQIHAIADMALQEGYISHPIPCVDYPVTDPFHDEQELALIFAFLGYDCDQVSIPQIQSFSDNVTY
ncbi:MULTISPECIES: hypothetical protein [unclassified Acinetobacter]|uniref:hypothetical protein n=1 Tax=unclassified Acinetobacter TaxID=196816 RepID=UPI0019094254|nr:MULTISPECIES: hypothetical protein [unclassified Acinetobacter]MBK0062393.1 hypothetical protein [Acinetobacter sp. S55]MBK0066197.1 hypothetical protein [Acinetobacter sp. S54]